MTHFLDSIVMPTFVKLPLKSNLWTLVSFRHVKSLEVSLQSSARKLKNQKNNSSQIHQRIEITGKTAAFKTGERGG